MNDAISPQLSAVSNQETAVASCLLYKPSQSAWWKTAESLETPLMDCFFGVVNPIGG